VTPDFSLMRFRKNRNPAILLLWPAPKLLVGR
jgi:hypothetical protein